MDSSWKQGVVRGGWDDVYLFAVPDPQPSWIRAADLLTPLVILGVTYRSVWQLWTGTFYSGWLSVSDLSSWVQTPGGRFLAGGPGFPYGMTVAAD